MSTHQLLTRAKIEGESVVYIQSLFHCFTSLGLYRFAFIEYESHRAAAMARRKLMQGRVLLWGHQTAVDWVEPELEVPEEVMAQVKVHYIRNLMLFSTERSI